MSSRSRSRSRTDELTHLVASDRRRREEGNPIQSFHSGGGGTFYDVESSSPSPSSLTRYAASTSLSAPAQGAADPSHIHPSADGSSLSLSDSTSRPPLRGVRLLIILVGLWASNFTFALQSSAIPTLAPRISASFAHSELASYLGSVFPLFSTAFTPIYGVLLDSSTIGRKGSMSIAGLLFGIGTIGCALSRSMGTLIAWRALAGAGGAGLLTVSSVITTDLTSLRERGYYQGLMMIVFGTGAAIGGPGAGWIADKWGWEMAFWAQLPFLLISLVVIGVWLPIIPTSTRTSTSGGKNDQPTKSSLVLGLGLGAFATFDFLGITTLLISVSSLLLGFSNHTASLLPWSSALVSGLLLTSFSTFFLFILVEWKFATHPVVPLTLFHGTQLPSIYAGNFLLSVAAQAFLYHIPIFFTSVLNTSSAMAGTHLLPNSIGLGIGSLLAGWIIRKTAKYSALSWIGLAMPIAGIWAASRWNRETEEWVFYLEVFPAGLGYSIFLCCSLGECATLFLLFSSVFSIVSLQVWGLGLFVRDLVVVASVVTFLICFLSSSAATPQPPNPQKKPPPLQSHSSPPSPPP